jgi:hypothetical protein
MPATSAGMTVESYLHKLQHRSFLHPCVEPCRSVAARRIPAGCRAKLSFEPFALPKRGKRSAEIRGRGTPHPLARLTIGPVPPAGGNCRPITRAGAPLGAPLRRFP